MSSFDPFEARMQFLQQLRKLNASQQSIHKVTNFALKYGSRCGEDLWECVMEQCGKAGLSLQYLTVNIIYFLDSLIEESISLGPNENPFQELVTKNLQELVNNVVPDNHAGILNLKSVRQILESWRVRRIIDPTVVNGVLEFLENRKYETSPSQKKRGHEQAFSKSEIVRRMEEDRERHKRLRERIWILPIPPLHKPLPQTTTTSPATPASPRPIKMGPPPRPHENQLFSGEDNSRGKQEEGMLRGENALDVEFEQLWDGADFDEDNDLVKFRAILNRLDKQSPAWLRSS
nr:hypothetical protein L203_04728 [Cryptococcus depauperatus CBS 7841]